MQLFSEILIGLVAIEHLYFLWLEMFAWTTTAPKVFKSFPKELFAQTTALAANQGLYNGFLSAGLIWSLLITDNEWSHYTAYFFLGCVITAGIYGSLTADRKIFFVQALPAIAAFVVTFISN